MLAHSAPLRLELFLSLVSLPIWVLDTAEASQGLLHIGESLIRAQQSLQALHALHFLDRNLSPVFQTIGWRSVELVAFQSCACAS